MILLHKIKGLGRDTQRYTKILVQKLLEVSQSRPVLTLSNLKEIFISHKKDK